MNERIKELAEQAWDYVDSQNPYASDEHEMFQEKFAELIVRECADVASINQHQYNDVGNYVKQHFGVE